MKKKISTIFLAFVFTVCLLSGSVTPSFADDYAQASFTGSDCTGSTSAAAAIDYRLSRYPQYSKYKGAGQCWGYAENFSKFMSGSRSVRYYKNLPFSEKYFLKKCLGVKAGTHIRFILYRGSSHAHSVVLLKVTSDKVYWTDNNFAGSNIISYQCGTVDDFVCCYGKYGYITMIAKPVKYKAYKAPASVAAVNSGSGGIRLQWLRTYGASRYYIYRSYSKTRGYHRIAVSKASAYTDTSASLGKTAYYRVRAIRKHRRASYGTAHAFVRLGQPVVTGTRITGTKYIKLTWPCVSGASRYAVYDMNSDQPRLISTVSENTYTDTTLTEFSDFNEYAVKAICDGNSGCNSRMSATAVCSNLPDPLPAPVLSGTTVNGSAQLTWTAVSGAEKYKIYRSDYQEDFWDDAICTTSDTSFCDTDRHSQDQYYYIVVAYDSNGLEGDHSSSIRL